MRRFSSLLFSSLLFVVFSCEKEDLTFPEPATPLVQIEETIPDLSPSDQLAHEIAAGYHNTIMDIGGNAETFTEFARNVSHPMLPGTSNEADNSARVLYELGLSPIDESETMMAASTFARDLDLDKYTRISEVQTLFKEWRQANGITEEATPLTYIVSKTAELTLTTSQATLMSSKPTASGNVNGEKINDGMLCSIRHRNWLSARLGLCGAANNSELARLLSEAVQAQLTQAASNALDSLAVGNVIEIFENEQGELSSIEELGADLVRQAISNAIARLVGAAWNWAWCTEQCDDCGPALGMTRRFVGCNFTSVRAIGSRFEDVEALDWVIDFNRDGVVDETFRTFENSLPSGVLGGGIVNARVDVFCDGGIEQNQQESIFTWPGTGNNLWVEINPVPDFQRPTASINAPGLQNGFFYSSGTRVCFTANNLRFDGHTFEGWSVDGGSPSTQGPGSVFCTQLSSTFTRTGNLRLRFRDNCTGALEVVNGPFFLICPNGNC